MCVFGFEEPFDKSKTATVQQLSEIITKALPEVRAVASFEARLNIISQTLTLQMRTKCKENKCGSDAVIWSKCDRLCLPVNLGKARYVSFEHLCKNLHVKVLLHALLGAQILQDPGDVGQENIIQGAALNGRKNVTAN